MLLLLLIAVIAIIVFGFALAVHFLFIIAAILAVVWLVSFFSGRGGRRGHSRSVWR